MSHMHYRGQSSSSKVSGGGVSQSKGFVSCFDSWIAFKDATKLRSIMGANMDSIFGECEAKMLLSNLRHVSIDQIDCKNDKGAIYLQGKSVRFLKKTISEGATRIKLLLLGVDESMVALVKPLGIAIPEGEAVKGDEFVTPISRLSPETPRSPETDYSPVNSPSGVDDNENDEDDIIVKQASKRQVSMSLSMSFDGGSPTSHTVNGSQVSVDFQMFSYQQSLILDEDESLFDYDRDII